MASEYSIMECKINHTKYRVICIFIYTIMFIENNSLFTQKHQYKLLLHEN